MGRKIQGQHSDHSDKDGRSVDNIQFTRPPQPHLNLPDHGFVVLDLNGTAGQVKNSWRRTILCFRLWCFIQTDKRFQFGHRDKCSSMLPSFGHFLVYMHFESKWLCAVIDGPSAYLDGYITRSTGEKSDTRVRENDCPSKDPWYIENAKKLPWTGSYTVADKCKLGYYALLSSFKEMHEFVDNLSLKSNHQTKDRVSKAGQTLILHLPEAARSDDLFQAIDDCFFEGDSLGTHRLNAARRWKKDCKQALKGIQDITLFKHGEIASRDAKKGKPRCSRNKEPEPEKKDNVCILENFRLLHREHHVHGFLRLQNLPVQLGKGGPINNNWRKQQPTEAQLGSFKFLTVRFTLDVSTRRTLPVDSKCKAESSATESVQTEPSSNTNRLIKMKCLQIQDTDATDHNLHGKQGRAESVEKQAATGLYNMGNTCYLNSTLQCLRSVPELKEGLARYSADMRDHTFAEFDQLVSHSLKVAASDTFTEIDHSDVAVRPLRLLDELKRTPFGQLNNVNMHQDVEECWSQLMDIFCQPFTSEASKPHAGQMKDLFRIDLTSRLHCAETGEENSESESVFILGCSISHDTKCLYEALKNTLKTRVEKISPLLGQNSIYTKESKINELPRYLTLQLGRMDYDVKSKQMIKISQKVDHPAHLDLYECCSDELKEKLQGPRQVLRTTTGKSSCTDTDKAVSSVPNEQLTGLYDLAAVVTHQGPHATSGHYVAWVKWILFDDQITSTCTEDDVLRAVGGSADEHMGYIYLYKARII